MELLASAVELESRQVDAREVESELSVFGHVSQHDVALNRSGEDHVIVDGG